MDRETIYELLTCCDEFRRWVAEWLEAENNFSTEFLRRRSSGEFKTQKEMEKETVV